MRRLGSLSPQGDPITALLAQAVEAAETRPQPSPDVVDEGKTTRMSDGINYRTKLRRMRDVLGDFQPSSPLPYVLLHLPPEEFPSSVIQPMIKKFEEKETLRSFAKTSLELLDAGAPLGQVLQQIVETPDLSSDLRRKAISNVVSLYDRKERTAAAQHCEKVRTFASKKDDIDLWKYIVSESHKTPGELMGVVDYALHITGDTSRKVISSGGVLQEHEATTQVAPSDVLSKTQRLALYAYSAELEGPNQEKHPHQLYRVMGKAVRAFIDHEDKEPIQPYLSLLWYINDALTTLPSPKTRAVVYRGVNLRIDPAEYYAGCKFLWPAYSSTSRDPTVANGFISKSGSKQGKGVLFVIDCSTGRDIEEYSEFPTEKELLLLMNTPLVVKGAAGVGIRQLLGVSDDVIVLECSEMDRVVAEGYAVLGPAVTLDWEGDTEGAKPHAREAYFRYVETPGGLFGRVFMSIWEKDYRGAMTWCYKALDKDPGDLTLNSECAMLQMVLRDFVPAELNFVKVLERLPRARVALYGYSKLLRIRGSYQKAFEFEQKLLDVYESAVRAKKAAPVLEGGVSWEFKGEGGKWITYPEEWQIKIELGYRFGCIGVACQPCRVIFREMMGLSPKVRRVGGLEEGKPPKPLVGRWADGVKELIEEAERQGEDRVKRANLSEPTMSMEEVVREKVPWEYRKEIPRVLDMIKLRWEESELWGHPLTYDEFLALYLSTYWWDAEKTWSFQTVANSALWKGKEVEWSDFIIHKHRAHQKLPPQTGVLYRGLGVEVPKGEIEIFKADAGCTTRIEIQNKYVPEEGKPRTFWTLEGSSARCIRDFSHKPDDEERRFLQGTQFRNQGGPAVAPAGYRYLQEIQEDVKHAVFL